MYNSFLVKNFLRFSLIALFMFLVLPYQAGAIELADGPCIDLTKTGPETAAPGDTITYVFTVENCGDMHFASGVAWIKDDPMFGSETIWAGDLYIGGIETISKNYLVKDSDCGLLVNTAVAYGSFDEDISTVDAWDSDSWEVFVDCLYNGCSPGYWRNHTENWAATGYSTGDDFDAVFGIDLFDPNITLEDAVNLGGGGFKKLARHGTAALISAAHPDVDYPFTVAEVIAAVQAGEADALASANDLGCPLD